jgi:hypothetical protein
VGVNELLEFISILTLLEHPYYDKAFLAKIDFTLTKREAIKDLIHKPN